MTTLQEQIDAHTSGSPAGMTMIPGYTQLEGTTGQLAPEVAEPPQNPPTPQIQLEEPVDSPTVISTDSMREQLAKAEKDLKDMNAQIEAGKNIEPTPTVEETPTTTGEESSLSSYESEIASYTEATNKILEERKNDFNKYLTRSDKLLKSQVKSIQKTFDVRRDQAQDVATNAIAASKVLGSRFGRQRYAPEIQAGIITGKENALITTLAEIDAFEAAAMAAAESAAYSRDYKTFLDEIDNLDTIRKERETTLNELESAMKEENERRADEAEATKNETQVIEQISGGVTDPIEIFTTLNGKVPYDVIKSYTDTLPGGGVTEFEFIKGDKYNSAGYFDPTTGDFVNIGGGVSINEDGSVGYGGPLTVNGIEIGNVTPATTLDDIDNLNISEAAKSFVRLFKEGRITQEDLLQRLSGDRVDRNLRNEVIGVVSRMAAPIQVDVEMDNYMKEQSNTAMNNIEDIFRMMGVEIREDGTFFQGADFGSSATAMSRSLMGWIPGSEAKDLNAKLDTINALIGFDALADMRASSPTGGALGQVTEKELKFLQSVRGSLDVGQSTPEFLNSLKEIYQSFQTLQKEVEQGTNSAVPLPTVMSNQSLLLGDEEEEEDLVPSALDSI